MRSRVARWPRSGRWCTTSTSSHAFYYLVIHAWTSFGGGEVWIRIPSVVATAVSAGLIALIGRRLAGARAGLLAGAAVRDVAFRHLLCPGGAFVRPGRGPRPGRQLLPDAVVCRHHDWAGGSGMPSPTGRRCPHPRVRHPRRGRPRSDACCSARLPMAGRGGGGPSAPCRAGCCSSRWPSFPSAKPDSCRGCSTPDSGTVAESGPLAERSCAGGDGGDRPDSGWSVSSVRWTWACGTGIGNGIGA